MDAKELDYYQTAAREHRGSTKQILWGSVNSQRCRFDLLVSVMQGLLGDEWRSMSLLDFGCGRGDLLPILQEARFHGRYVGVEAVKENFDDAIATLGLHDPGYVRLFHQQWQALEPVTDWPIDLVLVSGSFNATEPGNRNRTIQRMLIQARVGCVMNFLRETDRVPYHDSANVVTTPAEILTLFDPALFRLVVRADYMPHDFTVGAVRW